MTSSLKYNERSWGIDLVSYINQVLLEINLPIKKAGGEFTIHTENKTQLFPDLVLFSDILGSTAVQGWELKMPETPITSLSFIANAKEKAQRLNLKSFVLGNGREFVIYTLQNQEFAPYKHWIIPEIHNRNDMIIHHELWKKSIKEILVTISELVSTDYIKVTTFDNIFSDKLYNDFLTKHTQVQAESYTLKMLEDADFESQVIQWYNENKLEFGKLTAAQALAQTNIISWLNCFIFAHYLKYFNANAEPIKQINTDTSLEQGMKVMQQITEKCDFMSVFKIKLGMQEIGESLWNSLLELNSLLTACNFDDIDQKTLHKVIDNTLSYSRKKLAGQFSTPPLLAQLLTLISIKNRSQTVLDPCCGTGTIVKAVYDLKRQKGQTVEQALNTTWASDKFSFPLQLCTIALADPQGIGQVINAFQQDVLTIKKEQEVKFIDPFTGATLVKKLPPIHSVVSNLPFVNFLEVSKMNQEIEQLATSLGGKSDLYSYILLNLKNLVETNGRIGVIISNSWLGADWSRAFKQELLQSYKLLRVVTSAKGRWFQNADVVTNILVLENSQPPEEHQIDFISIEQDINSLTPEEIEKLSLNILQRNNIKDQLSLTSVSNKTLQLLDEYGLTWTACFTNLNWLNTISNKALPLSKFFDIKRGERRGWDEMFYPRAGHNIEPEFIKPVLLSTRNLGGMLIASPDAEAFCCSKTITELALEKSLGAYHWIEKFANSVNTIGKPLPQVLERANLHWYEMSDDTCADLVVSLNPDKRLCFYRLQERSFVNQRMIRFTAHNDQIDIPLMHALLNSTISLFLLEAAGFGRGLGALDLNANKLKLLKVLDPSLLLDADKDSIMRAFSPLCSRSILSLDLELQQEDRKNFDLVIIKAFKLHLTLDDVYASILRLYNIRQAVK